jgi:hypothetical protein
MKKSQKQQTTTRGGNHKLEKTNQNTQSLSIRHPSQAPRNIDHGACTIPPPYCFVSHPIEGRRKGDLCGLPTYVYICMYLSRFFFIHHPMYRGCCCCCSSSITLCTEVVVVVLHPPPYVPRLLLLLFFIHHPMYRGCCCCCSSNGPNRTHKPPNQLHHHPVHMSHHHHQKKLKIKKNSKKNWQLWQLFVFE